MNKSESIKTIAPALLKAQEEMGDAKKGATNPFFKSKYADLNSVREAVIPALNSNGISILQPTTTIEGRPFVETILLHESGEWISSLTEIICNKQNDAQSHGSGLSYARRYAISSIMNIGASDDDGQDAVKPNHNITLSESNKPWLNKFEKDGSTITELWQKAKINIEAGKVTMEQIKAKYIVSKVHQQELHSL